jgi:hypothetical protein
MKSNRIDAQHHSATCGKPIFLAGICCAGEPRNRRTTVNRRHVEPRCRRDDGVALTKARSMLRSRAEGTKGASPKRKREKGRASLWARLTLLFEPKFLQSQSNDRVQSNESSQLIKHYDITLRELVRVEIRVKKELICQHILCKSDVGNGPFSTEFRASDAPGRRRVERARHNS